MRSTVLLERKYQVIEDLTRVYLRLTKKRFFSFSPFRKTREQKIYKGLIEFSNSIGQFRLRTREYVKETNLSKEELLEIKSLLVTKEEQLQQSLYLRFINLSGTIFPLPSGLALVLIQNQIVDHAIEKYCVLLVWILISKKLIDTKYKLQRTLNAYGAISNGFDNILETDKQNLIIEDSL